jgi:phytoene dehydrogenase-like protein
MRYTKNPEGAIVGYEANFNNYGSIRIKNRTPVKGLYLASAWGNPGGGFTGAMSGGLGAFKDLMEDWGKKI